MTNFNFHCLLIFGTKSWSRILTVKVSSNVTKKCRKESEITEVWFSKSILFHVLQGRWMLLHVQRYTPSQWRMLSRTARHSTHVLLLQSMFCWTKGLQEYNIDAKMLLFALLTSKQKMKTDHNTEAEKGFKIYGDGWFAFSSFQFYLHQNNLPSRLQCL